MSLIQAFHDQGGGTLCPLTQGAGHMNRSQDRSIFMTVLFHIHDDHGVSKEYPTIKNNQ